MTTSKYGMAYFASGFTCNISIFAQDGSVVVSQGGVEMGQGLYTKVYTKIDILTGSQFCILVLKVELNNFIVRISQKNLIMKSVQKRHDNIFVWLNVFKISVTV